MHSIISRINRKLIYYFERILSISKKRVLVLGDSHVAVFNYINRNFKLDYFFEVGYVSGATASGISNSNSKTRALTIFQKKLRKTNKNVPIIIQLGEIDCGFLIWMKAEKNGNKVEDEMEKSLNTYFNFIKGELIEKGFKTICIMSATLPTIEDNLLFKGNISTLRKQVKATQSERTELTLKYNDYLKAFASENNCLFLDLSSDLLDDDSGLIKKKFLNKDPLDHHNNEVEYGKVIAEKLKNIFN